MEELQFIPIEFGTPEMDESVRIRYEVLRAPLGLEFTPEQIAEEASEWHLGAYNEHLEMLGSLIMKKISSEEVKMRQVAVAEREQSKGVGAQLVRASENWARAVGYKKITLHARATVVPFYLKQQYKTVGEPFYEVGIEHMAMEKAL